MELKISLEGMYDLHVHAAPSIARRKFTAVQAVRLASGEGMDGILLLDHTYNTAVVAHVVNEMGYRTRAYGSILLNESVGGLNPSIVETAIQLGTKQIQMPTYSSRSHKERYGDDQKAFPYQKKSTGISILDDRGRLVSEVEEILEIMQRSNAFLGTGHLSAKETATLVRRAREVKVRVMICSVSTDVVDMPLSIQKELAGDGVFMEHNYAVFTDLVHKKTPVESLVEQVRSIGPDRCVIATDVGQPINPDLVVALKDFISRLTTVGIREDEIDLMTRKNPRTLLGV